MRLCAGSAGKRFCLRNIFLLPVFLVVLLFSLFAAFDPAAAKDGRIDILLINDAHSQLLPVSTELHGIPMEVGGFVAVAETLQAEREKAPDLMLVLTGDIAYGPMYRNFGGSAEYGVFSKMGAVVATLGNHEFDYGIEHLRELLPFASFPILVSNIEFSHENMRGLFQKTFITENQGLKVGFFGLMTPTLSAVSSPGEGARVDPDLRAVAARCVADLRRQGADVIIALTHIGTPADLDLARHVSGIHAILGGHSHTLMPVRTVITGPEGWQTLVGQAGAYTHHAGRLGLVVRNGRTDATASTWRAPLIVSDPDYATDPLVQSVRAVALSFSEKLDRALSQPVGEFTAPADATQKLARGGESPMGNFVADAYRWRLNADIGVVNGGNIRGNRIYPAGPVSYRTLTEIQPYANTVTLVQLTGAQLWTLAEFGGSAFAEEGYNATDRVPTGGFLQYSGVRVELDVSAPPMEVDGEGRVLSPGSRVRSLLIERNGQWAEPAPEKLYTVATASWTANGGDRISVMNEASLKEATELKDIDVLAAWLTHTGGTAAPKAEGRIVILNGGD